MRANEMNRAPLLNLILPRFGSISGVLPGQVLVRAPSMSPSLGRTRTPLLVSMTKVRLRLLKPSEPTTVSMSDRLTLVLVMLTTRPRRRIGAVMATISPFDEVVTHGLAMTARLVSPVVPH